MINNFGILILTMFGIGRSKYAPGTLASLITCLIYFPIFIYKPNFFILIIIFAIFSIYSVILIDQLQNKFKKFNLSSDECLAIEDTEESMKSALRAKILCVAFPGKLHEKKKFKGSYKITKKLIIKDVFSNLKNF